MEIQENLKNYGAGAALLFTAGLSVTLVGKVANCFFKTVLPCTFYKGFVFGKACGQLVKKGIFYSISKGLHYTKMAVPYCIHASMYVSIILTSYAIIKIANKKWALFYEGIDDIVDHRCLIIASLIASLMTIALSPSMTKRLTNSPMSYTQSARHALEMTVFPCILFISLEDDMRRIIKFRK